MKTKVRTQYTAECKREALAMVASSEQTLPEVAKALGLSRSALGRWRREQAAHGAQAFVGQGVARDEELVRLRRELARLKKERDFLHSAATYFAGTEK